MHVKKRYQLAVLAALLIIAVIVISGTNGWVVAKTSDYLSTLVFYDGNEAAKEKLMPYYSSADDVYYLFLPSYTKQDQVSLYFEGAKKAVFRTGDTSLEFTRGMYIGELSPDITYQVDFENAAGKITASGSFQMMQSENLPTLFLETKSGTMEKVDADKSYQEKGWCTLLDADGNLLYEDEIDHITGRGNATWDRDKKGYGIKLKDDVDLLDMGSADAWILLCNVEDISYIRNKITYDMALAAGMTGSPECRYIDLYINHEYHGMYLLSEKIEPGENRVPIADLSEENKKLNPDIKQAKQVTTDTAKSVQLSANPSDISGGYILERDVTEKYNEEVSGFRTAELGDKYTIKSPEYASEEETGYIENLVNGMERAVVSEDGIDAETGKSLADYIDLTSFAQKYLVEEIGKNNGGGATSSYFYKPQDAVSTRLFAGPVWDYDKAYAKVQDFDASPRDLCYLTQREEGTTLFWYLNRHSEFQDAVKACYKEFFSDYIEKVISEKIPEYTALIAASAKMDTARWKESYEKYEEVPEFEQRVSVVTDYLIQRKTFLDQVWLQDAELKTVHFSALDWSIDTYMSVIEGESLQAVPIPGHDCYGNAFGGWYTEDGEEFDISQPIYEDVTYYAKGVPDEQ